MGAHLSGVVWLSPHEDVATGCVPCVDLIIAPGLEMFSGPRQCWARSSGEGGVFKAQPLEECVVEGGCSQKSSADAFI